MKKPCNLACQFICLAKLILSGGGILTPDIGMVGYLAGSKVGAITYNLFHHKAIAVLVLCLGWYLSIEWFELCGIILFGHVSMDRMFGYGLKYDDSFHNTHLGWIGKELK